MYGMEYLHDLHDGSGRKKSATDNELKRKGAVGLALFFALASGEEDPSGIEQKLKKNGDHRAKIVKRRIKAREARQERRMADQLADAFILAEGAKQARFDGLLLPVVAPAYRSAVESIVASSNVRLSEQGHVPGFAENRLIETIRASGLGVECSKLLEKAVHRAAKRCSGIEEKATPRKRVGSSTPPPRRIVWVTNDLHVQEMKKLCEQLRASRNRLKDTNGVQPSAAGCPSRLVEASADLLAKIGQKYPSLERELEALGCAILDFGVADKKLLFDKFLSITTVMPPDLIRDLFFHLVEWKELPNVN